MNPAATPETTLTLSEQRAAGLVILKLVGELDLATAPLLDERLKTLGNQQVRVRLDLSEVAFVDSTGIRLLFRVVKEGREGGMPLEVGRKLTPQVKRVLGILHLEEYILGDPVDQG